MAVWLFIVALFFGSTSGPQRAGNDGAIISDAHLVRLANYNRTLTAPCAIWPARFSNHFAAHGIWGADCDAPILKNKTRSEMAHPVKVLHHCTDEQHLLVWPSSLRASKSTFYARLMSENELQTFFACNLMVICCKSMHYFKSCTGLLLSLLG